jgi:hypothetical protein
MHSSGMRAETRAPEMPAEHQRPYLCRSEGRGVGASFTGTWGTACEPGLTTVCPVTITWLLMASYPVTQRSSWPLYELLILLVLPLLARVFRPLPRGRSACIAAPVSRRSAAPPLTEQLFPGASSLNRARSTRLEPAQSRAINTIGAPPAGTGNGCVRLERPPRPPRRPSTARSRRCCNRVRNSTRASNSANSAPRQ